MSQIPMNVSAPIAWRSRPKSERILRRLLAFNYSGLTGLYADDGELQDNRERPHIDFVRDSAEQIERSIIDRGRNAMRAATDTGEG